MFNVTSFRTAFFMDQKLNTSVYIHGSTPEEQERLSLLNQLLNQRCINTLPLVSGEKVLDVGSGLGQFTKVMSLQVGTNGRVVGIERDKAQLTKALPLMAESLGNLEFRQGNAYDLPLEAEEWGTFDMVHSRFLLEHLATPQLAVDQMVKAVKEGGAIILMDDDHSTFRPTPEPLGFSLIWSAYCRSYERIGNDPYIGRRLVTLLRNSGINKIKNGSVFFGGCQSNEDFPIVADNLIGILMGAKDLILKEGLLDESSFDQAINSLHQWKLLPDAALNYSIDWVKGIK